MAYGRVVVGVIRLRCESRGLTAASVRAQVGPAGVMVVPSIEKEETLDQRQPLRMGVKTKRKVIVRTNIGVNTCKVLNTNLLPRVELMYEVDDTEQKMNMGYSVDKTLHN